MELLKMKTNLTLFFLLICTISFGQVNRYSYSREILGKHSQWNRIVLPNDIFGKLKSDFSDIRIMGITGKNDTIEAPYLLQIDSGRTIQKAINFKLLNQSHNKRGSYFTYEIPRETTINQFELTFSKQNFDFKIRVEGSQNQEEWFAITDNYRILSIKNQHTDYQFTKVVFPDSKYRYYRICFIGNENPELTSAKVLFNEVENGNSIKYKIRTTKISVDKQSKQTIVDTYLKSAVPISMLKLFIEKKFDYYRPIQIQYLSDSTKTPKGWIYNYVTLASAMLSSIENNEFHFKSTILQNLRIIIDNNANQPLKIDSVNAEGFSHGLIVRFAEPARYYLSYGNKEAVIPDYDIIQFSNNIPKTQTELKLGKEQYYKNKNNTIIPLFQNKVWLWVIMAIIIIVLGWLSFKMIRKVS